jgi:hypothetical protein
MRAQWSDVTDQTIAWLRVLQHLHYALKVDPAAHTLQMPIITCTVD